MPILIIAIMVHMEMDLTGKSKQQWFSALGHMHDKYRLSQGNISVMIWTPLSSCSWMCQLLGPHIPLRQAGETRFFSVLNSCPRGNQTVLISRPESIHLVNFSLHDNTTMLNSQPWEVCHMLNSQPERHTSVPKSHPYLEGVGWGFVVGGRRYVRLLIDTIINHPWMRPQTWQAQTLPWVNKRHMNWWNKGQRIILDHNRCFWPSGHVP
jgi:hypothetical protein